MKDIQAIQENSWKTVSCYIHEAKRHEIIKEKKIKFESIKYSFSHPWTMIPKTKDQRNTTVLMPNKSRLASKKI